VAVPFDLTGVTVRLDGHVVLRELDLTVGAGELVAIVGPSGAGKTTLLRLLNGTLTPEEGRVAVGGAHLARLSAAELRSQRARIGFVHQDHSLVPILRVSQNVILGALGRRGLLRAARAVLWPRSGDLERAHALLERVGIPEKLFQRTDSLSGGQSQRVAIARALFQEPAALLADEPVASVDPARGRAIMELLRDLARERGLTLVASLHDLELATDFFPRTVGLREGRILFDAPTDSISSSDFAELYRLEGQGGGVAP